MDPRLVRALTTGDIDLLKQIASDDLLLQQTPLNNSTLHVAVKSDQKACVEEICNRCQTLLTQVNLKGDTPLHIASRLGLHDIASVLIDRCKIHQLEDIENGRDQGRVLVVETLPVQQLMRMRNNEKDTALHEAVRNSQFKVVKVLTEADPTFEYLECNSAGETPLYIAGEYGLLDCAVQILQTCPSSAHGGPLGRTALHAAVRSTNTDVTSLFLHKKSGLIREADDYGCTALHYAAFYGMVAMVVQILNVDPSIAYMTNTECKTALHVLGDDTFGSEILDELTQHCPDCWELLDKNGQNFFHAAVENDQLRIVENVISKKSTVVKDLLNQPDNNGNTPLHLASKSVRLDILRVLCNDDRVNKNVANKDNLTALGLAYLDYLENGHRTSAYRTLLRAGGVGLWRKDVIQHGVVNYHRIDHNNTENSRKHMEKLEQVRQTHLLVAVLIATVTFAAGFTPPGGYNSDGQHKGLATLAGNPAFMLFVLFNSIAMIFSTFSVFIYFWSIYSIFVVKQATEKDNWWLNRWIIIFGQICTFSAIIAMVIAFLMGTYVVLPHSPALAIPSFMLGCIVIICTVFFNMVGKLGGIPTRRPSEGFPRAIARGGFWEVSYDVTLRQHFVHSSILS